MACLFAGKGVLSVLPPFVLIAPGTLASCTHEQATFTGFRDQACQEEAIDRVGMARLNATAVAAVLARGADGSRSS